MTTGKRPRTVLLPLLLLTIVSGLGPCVSDALAATIAGQFSFRDNRSSNPAGAVAGDVIAVGATNITPSGAGTTVQAVQGTTTLNVLFLPSTVFPDNYFRAIPFDPQLTGSWTLTATDGTGSVSVPTNAIPNPELIPLVNNLQVSGTLLTPHLSWVLPDLTGLGVTRIFIRVRDLDNFINGVSDTIFSSANLPATATAFDVPTNVLKPNKHYSFDVLLDNIVTPPMGAAFLQNRSETFTDVYSTTPEPSTLLSLGSGLGGLMGFVWRRRRRTQ